MRRKEVALRYYYKADQATRNILTDCQHKIKICFIKFDTSNLISAYSMS